MTPHLLTKIMIISVFCFAVIYDITIVLIDRSATISKIIQRSSLDYPSIALLFGILAGHFFWPMMIIELEYWKYSLPILSVLFISFLIIDILLGLPNTALLLWVLLGILLGHFLWPQNPM